MEPTENTDLDKLLQEVKRTILDNRIFLDTLKEEPLAEEIGVEESLTAYVRDEQFEEL